MRDTFLLTINWASSLTVLPFIQEEIPASIANKSFALPRLARRFRPWFQLGQILLATNSTLSAVRREQDLTEPEMHVRPSRLSVNGNLFGNISTHRRYSTARDPYFA